MSKAESRRGRAGIIVRGATEFDVAGLVELGNRLAEKYPYLVVSGVDPVTGAMLGGSADFESGQTMLDEIFVAEVDEQLAGLAICRRHPPPERDTVLQLDLGVDSRFHRRGLGSELIRKVMKWALKAGIHRVQLSVVADNLAAISLYRKHGFVIEGTLQRGFRIGNDFHDIHVMARLLNDRS